MRKLTLTRLSWVTLFLAAGMLLAHIFSFDKVKIDNTSIILLLIVALIPFVPAVTKIRFGDFEAEIDSKEVQKISDKVSSQVSESKDETIQKPELDDAIERIRETVMADPVLALAKLRIELEKVLAKLYRITHRDDEKKRPLSAAQLAQVLGHEGVLRNDIVKSVREVLSICNRAIHGEAIRQQDAETVARSGTALLIELSIGVGELLLKRVESSVVDWDCVNEYLSARYKVTTITPLVENPEKNVRILDQEGLGELLDGYGEYAEFLIEVRKIDSERSAPS